MLLEAILSAFSEQSGFVSSNASVVALEPKTFSEACSRCKEMKRSGADLDHEGKASLASCSEPFREFGTEAVAIGVTIVLFHGTQLTHLIFILYKGGAICFFFRKL
jgi:hypothetical protein